MVVHRVSGGTVQPAAAASLLQSQPHLMALASIIGQLGAVVRVIVARRQYKSFRLAYSIPRGWATFGLDGLAYADGIAGAVADVGEPHS